MEPIVPNRVRLLKNGKQEAILPLICSEVVEVLVKSLAAASEEIKRAIAKRLNKRKTLEAIFLKTLKFNIFRVWMVKSELNFNPIGYAYI